MKKIISLSLLIVIMFSLVACGNKQNEETDQFTVKVICESEDIYKIFYTCYLNDEDMGHGADAQYSNKALTKDSDIKYVFSKARLENAEDLSTFAIDFSPYGKDDENEICTTDKLYFEPEYGKSYTVIFSGDKENGFKAELQ